MISGRQPGATFPLVPGHEIAGRIDAVGDSVQGFAPGERVAVGWFGGNCGYCVPCREGDFINCTRLQVPGLSYPGGYADAVVVPATALARIPEEFTAPDAAPMGCAGVTVFNALRTSAARPGDLVAILGIGGLGHLGVQFAARLGFETIAIARGADKEPLAKQLGAHHYIDNQAQDTAAALQALGGAKVVLGTVTSNAAITDTLGGLTHRDELIVIGVNPEPFQVSPFALIGGAQDVLPRLGCLPRYRGNPAVRRLYRHPPHDRAGAPGRRAARPRTDAHRPGPLPDGPGHDPLSNLPWAGKESPLCLSS
jgi:alcohol dehydrogenase